MPLDRPTLTDLRKRVAADVTGRVGLGPLLRRSVLNLLSQALAGAVHGVYGQLDYIFRQLWPDTADTESLERQSRTWGVPRRDPAYARGEVLVTGTIGAAVPEGTGLVRADGTTFEVEIGTSLDVSPGPVRVRSVEPGVLGNTSAAEEMAFAEPIADIDPSVTVGAAGIGAGADLEGDEQLRQRLLQRLRSPGQGGSAQDYVGWALAVPGVTRAWCYPVLNGLGTVGVSVMRDLDVDPYPSGAALDEVQAYIDARRPVGMVGVEVFAPEPLPVDFRISVTPDTPEIRSGIEAAISALLIAEGAAAPRSATTEVPLSRIAEAISSVDGERSHELIEPSVAPMVEPRQLLHLGAVVWS